MRSGSPFPTARGLWTVLDADYRPVAEAASFLEHLRLGRDAAEGTCRMYAGELALYLEWCVDTDRDLVRGAAELGRFVQHLRTVPVSRAGRGQGRPRGAGRITHVLSVVRELYKHAVATRAVDSKVLAYLYEVADDRYLPAELRPEGAGLVYHARPRHTVRQPRQARVNRATGPTCRPGSGGGHCWRDRPPASGPRSAGTRDRHGRCLSGSRRDGVYTRCPHAYERRRRLGTRLCVASRTGRKLSRSFPIVPGAPESDRLTAASNVYSPLDSERDGRVQVLLQAGRGASAWSGPSG